MDFADKELSCIDCGSSFPFTAAEQQFYEEKGLTHEPKRCRNCRQTRKARNPGGRGPGAIRGASDGYGPPRHEPRMGYDNSNSRGGYGQRNDGPPLYKADFGPAPWAAQPDRGWDGGGRGRGGRSGGGGPRGGPNTAGRPSRGGGGFPSAQRFDATCSDCGSATQVPFQPNGVQPVYCRGCLPKHKGRRSEQR